MPTFRGYAFINSVVEFAELQPDVVTTSRDHKSEMVEVIAHLLPLSASRCDLAREAAFASDSATVHAQKAANVKMRRSVARLPRRISQALSLPHDL